MATVVERPMSALNDNQVISQQSRRPSVEIIDVDLLDESTLVRPIGNRQPETILLIDSDDEDLNPRMSLSNNSQQGNGRRRLFSPPPPPPPPLDAIHTPPVPRVPRHYSGLTSLPMRRAPPRPTPPEVVRPINEPFAFEVNMRASSPVAGPSALHDHPNRHRRAPYADFQAAPPSHHVPALGLGGALISLNRAGVESRIEQRRQHMRDFHSIPEPTGYIGRAGNAMRRMYSFFTRNSPNTDEEEMHMQMLLAQDLGIDLDRFDNPARPFAQREVIFRNRDRPMEYIAEFTHPGTPESGFTFDFAPPDPLPMEAKPRPVVIDLVAMENDSPVAGPSTNTGSPSPSTTVNTLLVCARCLDPLVLGSGLVGEEVRKRKVWALRCGHLIDGKCLDIIGAPQPEVEVDEDGNILENEQAVNSESSGSWKGKGKAREIEGPASLPENSIRSRLRSRGIPSVLPIPSPASSTSNSRNVSTLGKRKRPSSSKPRIDATYEWKCPVAGCGHPHASVQVDGAWIPEPVHTGTSGKGKGKRKWDLLTEDGVGGRGPIAVFV